MTRSFGTLLRQLRLVEGITQATLAARAGVSERTVQELERDSARPRRDTARRLIAALAPPAEVRAELESVTPSPRRRAARRSGRPGQHRQAAPGDTRERRSREFPMLRSRLIGRERESAEVRHYLLDDDVALVTLTGTGGVGKTRLALQVAGGLRDHFSGGVHLVELSTLVDPTLVLSSIAGVVDVPTPGDRSVLDVLVDALRGRAILLVLDNFEQILAAAPDVAELLAMSPGLKVIVTSREPLRLRDEREYVVPPLSLPDPQHSPAFEALVDCGAVDFFIDRARAIRADFAVTRENVASVVEICCRLDGLPLAIELAAARVRTLTPQAMVGRLERRLPLLTGGAQDSPERQRTLRDAIGWSHDLLREPERLLFRRLSVFVGGWTLDAAEAVCRLDDEEGAKILDVLDSLASKSLIVEREDAAGDPRFTMLETIREFGAEQLEAGSELEAVRRRHADHYMALAERAEPELREASQLAWMDLLEADHDNLRAVLSWSLSGIADAGFALRLAGALYRFWQVRHLREGYRSMTQVLDTVSHPGVSDRPELRAPLAKVLNGAGVLARDLGEVKPARRFLEESLAVRRVLGDPWGIAQSLNNLASIAIAEQEHDFAEPLIRESVSLWQGLGDPWGLVRGYGLLGLILVARGQHAEATSVLHQSLTLARSLGDIQGIGMQLHHLGSLAAMAGNYEQAEQLLQESAALQREKGDRAVLARVLDDLAMAVSRRGDHQGAATLLRESIDLCREVGSPGGIGRSLRRLAEVEVANRQPWLAARLLGAADAVGGAMGPLDSTGWAPSPEESEARVRAELSDQDFEVAFAEGRAMSLEQAIAYALEKSTSG